MAQRRFALINKPVSITETNDLTAAVTWANVPDANITESSVTQHAAALTITESQITDGTILARVASAEVITGGWTIEGGATTGLTFKRSGDADDSKIYYDGASLHLTNNRAGGSIYLNSATSVTGGKNFQVLAGGLNLVYNPAGDGYFRFRAYDAGYAELQTVGTVTGMELGASGFVRFVDGGEVRIQDGAGLRISDAADTDYLTLNHDGTDFNISGTNTTDLNITGISGFNVVNYAFDVDQTVGAGQDNYVLTYDNSSGLISLEAAAGGGGSSAESKYKTADESVVTSAVLQNDDHLAGYTIDAAGVYKIEGCVAVGHTSSTGDVVFQLTYSQTPQESTFVVDGRATSGTTAGDSSVTAAGTVNPAIANTNDHVFQFSGFIVGHATNAGTMTLQWAQASASGTTTLRLGSWITLTKLN